MSTTPDGDKDRNDDLYYFTGDHLELAPMLREQLILAEPMHPLRSQECRGLCGRCGQDFNEGPCRCKEERPEVRFRRCGRLRIILATPVNSEQCHGIPTPTLAA